MKFFQSFLAFVFLQTAFLHQNKISAQELIRNGNFQVDNAPSLAEWTYTSNISVISDLGCESGYSAFFVALNTTPDNGLSQSLDFTSAGTCNVEFYALISSELSNTPVKIKAYLGGDQIFSKTIKQYETCKLFSKENIPISGAGYKDLQISASTTGNNNALISNVSLAFSPTPPAPPVPPKPTPQTNPELVYANAVEANNTKAAAQFVCSLNAIMFVSNITPQWGSVDETFVTKSKTDDISLLVAGSGLNPHIATGGKAGHDGESKYHFWIAGEGSYMHQDKSGNADAYHAGSGAGFLGFDVSLDRNIIGFGGGYDYSHVKHDKSSTYSNQNNTGLATYYAYSANDWNTCISIFGGFNLTDSFRSLKNVQQNSFAESSYITWILAEHFDFTFSHLYKNDWFTLRPKISADYATSFRQSYKEEGEGDFLTLHPSEISGFISVKGAVSASELCEKEVLDIIFKQSLGWNYQRSFNPSTTTISLIGIGPSSVVPSNANIQNLFNLGLSVLFKPKKHKRPEVCLEYNLSKGSKYYSFSGDATISLSF